MEAQRVTKIEVISCCWCAAIFEVAIPAKAWRVQAERGVNADGFWTKCPNEKCKRDVWIHYWI